MSLLESIKRFQNAPVKDRNRDLIVEIALKHLSDVNKPIAHTLCGGNAIFERKLQNKKTFIIKCYEHNKSVYNEAIKNGLPKSTKLTHGPWLMHTIERDMPNLVWADYCSPLNMELLQHTLFEIKRQIFSGKRFVYAVTFGLQARSVLGGQPERIRVLSKKTNTKKNMEGMGSVGVISLVCKYIFKETKLFPCLATYYGNSTDEKMPMTTIVWTNHPDYYNNKERWKPSLTIGNSSGVFINVIQEKRDMKKMKKYKGKKSPQQRAWITRRKNAKTKSNNELSPQQRAWITRRMNQKKS